MAGKRIFKGEFLKGKNYGLLRARKMRCTTSILYLLHFTTVRHWSPSDGYPSVVWSDRVPRADVILVVEIDLERAKKLTEPNQALTLHIIKNRGGEKSKLAFEFVPAFSKFTEVAPA